MQLKKRPEDFYVEELLDLQLGKRGDYWVHRLRKRKLGTAEAVRAVAREAGVAVGEIGMAGLKDRQGVTVQYISLPRRRVSIKKRGLEVEAVGRSAEPVTSKCSRGNRFVITLRALRPDELERIEENGRRVIRWGVPNYFGDQRFGCIRHGQGLVVRPLLAGRPGEALKWLLAGISPFEKKAKRKLKECLQEAWGDWERCRAIGRSLGCEGPFRHLQRRPGDLFGAFRTLPRTIRLMHLYAFQSYLWNQALSLFLLHRMERERQVRLSSELGRLIAWRDLEGAPELLTASLPLPAGDLELPRGDREGSPEQQLASALRATLAQEKLSLEELRLPRATGMSFKAEPRPIAVVPEKLGITPPRPDPDNLGGFILELSFALPRGCYATVVLERLRARAGGGSPGVNPPPAGP